MQPVLTDFVVPVLKPPAVVLIGPPGVGKTSVGKTLAEKLRCQFLDIDILIEQGIGKTINSIFEEYGEPTFRELESSVLRKLTRGDSSGAESRGAPVGTVIGTGAGLPITPGNFEMLNSLGYLVYLSAPLEVLLMRLSNCTDRPLLHSAKPAGDENTVSEMQAKLAGLLLIRKPVYEKAKLVVDTSQLSIFQVAERIIDLLPLTAQPQS